MHTQQTYSEPDELRARFTRWLEVLISRARNRYLQKEAYRLRTISLEDIPEDQWPTTPPALDETRFDFENECLVEAFSSLSVESQKLLRLLFIYEMRPKDVARLLDCKTKELYNSKYAALKKLRTILSEEEGIHHETK
jgi:DNA-directed RNA polymerase specialized sigma subunit, sigma24 homolog